MKIEQQVTSLEISKRLKELGVNQDSLFYWWKPEDKTGKHIILYEGDMEVSFLNDKQCFSAFTVAELGEMLPRWVCTIKHNEKDFYCWVGEETDPNNEADIGEEIEPIHADTEANARGKMLIYLIENKLIDAREL